MFDIVYQKTSAGLVCCLEWPSIPLNKVSLHIKKFVRRINIMFEVFTDMHKASVASNYLASYLSLPGSHIFQAPNIDH